MVRAPSRRLADCVCAVNRISLVSPERSKQIETIIARMAQSGQLRGRVTENQLIDLLDQVRGALAVLMDNTDAAL